MATSGINMMIREKNENNGNCRVVRPFRQRISLSTWLASVSFGLLVISGCSLALADAPEAKTALSLGGTVRSHVPKEHLHVRELLANALQMIDARNKMIDPVSGYPYEGWNHAPEQGLFLRSFTQLTAIGQYMELLANLAEGTVETPVLSREQAMRQLGQLVATLRRDQQDPRLAAKGLLVNFLDLASGKRLGPLTSEVEKQTLLDQFGKEKGDALWQALKAKGWIIPRDGERTGSIVRSKDFGANHFDGPLGPFHDPKTVNALMETLDRRVVLAVFGDNANLSASVAKTIGALLDPALKDDADATRIRRDLDAFLDAQREGYEHLYDREVGLFYFGWDATHDRLFGWEDLEGKWVTGHMDYFINEFRAPAIFVTARFGLPLEAIGNLGFKMKPYRTTDERDLTVLAPWDGSAFQGMGLGFSLDEANNPTWRQLLRNLAEVEVDYATRNHLPGFLSESYTGNGTQYTGDVGIPLIAATPKPRITDAASLYTLGVAYSISPVEVEHFLKENWAVVSLLLTDHGPWEGYNVTHRTVIPFQTSTHTISLILGILGTGSEHMSRYLIEQGIDSRLEAILKVGEGGDFLADEVSSFAWSDRENGVTSTREGRGLRVKGERNLREGIAFVSPRADGWNLSGCRLRLSYDSRYAHKPVSITLKTPRTEKPAATFDYITKEIVTRFDATGGREQTIEVLLPAYVGLAGVKEVVLTHERDDAPGPIDLHIKRFDAAPMEPR